MMSTGAEGRRSWADALAVLLPALAVALFHLLRLRLKTPTAAGLAFLAAAVVAFYFFPRRRLSARRLAFAMLLAVAVAVLLGFLL